MSFKPVSFESLGAVSYSPSIVITNYGSILHYLRDKARYWLKIVIFFIHLCIRPPGSGGSRRNVVIPFGREKLEWWGYQMVKKNFEDMCNRLDTIPACDGRTDIHLATV